MKHWKEIMSDDDFCSSLGFSHDPQKGLCQKIREATAHLCGLEREQIKPEHAPSDLSKRTFDGWDNEALILELEKLLGTPVTVRGTSLPSFALSRFFWFSKGNSPNTYGEWVKQSVAILGPVLFPPGK